MQTESTAETYGRMLRYIDQLSILSNRLCFINSLLPCEASISVCSSCGETRLEIGGRLLFAFSDWDCDGMDGVLARLDLLCDFVWLLDPYM